MTLPEGWVAVPREPTEVMVKTAVACWDAPDFEPPGPEEEFAAIYSAMLAAAPSLPLVEDRDPAVAAKLEAYEACHETAVGLGYPSITEALEHLEDLASPALSERVERLEGALREIIASVPPEDAANDSWDDGKKCGWERAAKIARVALTPNETG